MRYSSRAATSSDFAAHLCLPVLRGLGCRGASGTRTRMSMDFLRIKRLAAFGAHHYRIEVLAAFAVLMQQRPPAFVDHVRVTPMHERHHDWIEIESFLGENILMPFGRLLIGNAAQHALADQFLQPFGKQMPGNSKCRLKSLEAPRAQEAFPQDQKGPAVANYPNGTGKRTRL